MSLETVMEMKIFKLSKKAYHSLENRHEINISEYGILVPQYDSRVAYHIKLDEDNEIWVYCTYTDKRDDMRDFIRTNNYVSCLIHADFDQVTKFNTLRRKKK